MKLYWKVYLFLAATTLVSLVFTIWISFSVIPGILERQRAKALDSFQEQVLAGGLSTREEITALADSMDIIVHLVREDRQQPPGLQDQFPPPGAQPVPGAQPMPGDRDWRNVRIIAIPGTQFAILATTRIPAPRFVMFVLLALVLFASQAVALAFGLKSVFRRTSLLARATGNFGRGQLTARYPDNEKGDEIDELGRSFNQMAERIISLLDSHNELLNSVAHELRTPMARLGFALELARDNPETLEEKLSLMEKDLFELDGLVSELLEFSRIRNSEAEMAPVSPLDVCHEAADAERARDGVVISVSSSGPVPSVKGDYRLLLRAVSNLVRNAVRYADSSVEVTVSPYDRGVSIKVVDDGPGFPGGFTERAMSPFVKGPDSKGTGLGLSIVQRIAEKHGGSLVLSNGVGGGALAELLIPIQ